VVKKALLGCSTGESVNERISPIGYALINFV
jgi:hypothetical protein